MTSQRSLRIKTRILSAFVLSLAALTVVIAFAGPAQQAGTSEPYEKSAAATVPAQPMPTRAVRPALPTAVSAESVALSRLQTKRPDARGMILDNRLSFLPVETYLSGGTFPLSVAVADLNGDGKPDAVVANADSNTVGVLLGNGDGTFQTAVTYGSETPYSVVVADVNGDGKADVVVANADSDTVGVLLGNGDGTFQPAATYGSGGVAPLFAVVADVNGDGKPDIVVSNENDNTLGVLLGLGDGTFQAAVAYGSGSTSFTGSVAVADVNGDGKPDLVVADECDSYPTCTNGTVGVLLGNGDGTFQAAVLYFTGGSEANVVVVADVNGDGKLDIVVGNNCFSCGSSTVSVQLGNGDGTFQSAVSYILEGMAPIGSVTVADVNGDGYPDLLVAGSVGNAGRVGSLVGNGDGTFQSAVLYQSGGELATSIAVADVNGDGKPDLLAANGSNFASNNVGVLLNNTIFSQSATTTTLTSSLNPSIHGQSITWTATVSTSGPIAPTGTVNFKWGPDGMGTGTLNASGVATFTTSILKPGPYKITAVYKGDASNLTSTSAVLHQGVSRN